MASGSWTPRQDKLFESALALYYQDTPDRWQKVARFVGGGTSVDEVKRRYELLEEDVRRIESGRWPYPNYQSSAAGGCRRGPSSNGSRG